MKQAALSTPNYRINRMAYAAFLLTGVVFVINHDPESSMIYFALSLVFDPFDPLVKWEHRPAYQRIWLYTHVILLLIGFSYILFIKH